MLRVLAGAGAFLLSGCSPEYPLSWFVAGGDAAEQARQLTVFVLVLGVLVFVGVEGLLFYALLRFRRPAVPGQLPPQVHGHRTLEVVWTLVPVAIVTAIAVPTVRTIFSLATLPEPNPLRVEVIGHQWWWEFRYPEIVPGKTITTANELRIPVGRTVLASVSSADVIHSFWVPRLSGTIDVIPGRQVNQVWFNAWAPGEYYGWCKEYCGTQHAQMRFRVVAMAAADFDRWVQARLSPPAPPASGPARQGYELFGQLGCSACHTVDGTPYQGRVGPNLTNIGERATVGAGVLPNDPQGQGLFRWVKNPQEVKPGAKMPALGLSDEQLKAIVAYLLSLK